MIDKIKTLLGVKENSVDDLLLLLLQNAQNRILAHLPSDVTELPSDLEWIALELTVARYNRIGNEGMDSYSQDGQSMSFSSDEMSPYMSAIQAWRERQESNKKGVVRFL